MIPWQQNALLRDALVAHQDIPMEFQPVIGAGHGGRPSNKVCAGHVREFLRRTLACSLVKRLSPILTLQFTSKTFMTSSPR